jgi:ribonuclease J
MRCRIHRGAVEIGGSCVELEHHGATLVLDVGLPLDASLDDPPPLPAIPGLTNPGDSLVGVVISHGHPDHYGLAVQLDARVPVFTGAATERILREALFFSPAGADLNITGHLHDRAPLAVDPFTVTPYLADHSAFDAYSLLVEAGGRRLFYSGDVRSHGRKHSFSKLLVSPPASVDATLLEGTRVLAEADDPTRQTLSEIELEERCVEVFTATAGMVLAAYSAQNIDRLVTLYRAAKRTGRLLVMDLYTAAIAAATRQSTIPQSDWEGVRVFVPQSQRVRVKRAAAFERVAAVRAARLYPEDLKSMSDRLVLTFRASMTADLERADCLDGATCIWSMWGGYLRQPTSKRLLTWLDAHAIGLTQLHSSGHATVADLQRLAGALGGRIVPIHTSAPGRFGELFDNVEPHADGEWWPV